MGFFDKLKGGHRSGAKPPALSVHAKAGVIYAPVSGTLTAAMPLCELGTATDLCHKVIACLQSRRDYLSIRRA